MGHYAASVNGIVGLQLWRLGLVTFSAWLALCEGNPSFTGGFPNKGPVNIMCMCPANERRRYNVAPSLIGWPHTERLGGGGGVGGGGGGWGWWGWGVGGWGWVGGGVGGGGILVSVRPSVRSSVRPASSVRSVAPTVLVGSISYLYILSSYFRSCVACKASWKFSKFEFLAFIFQICNFDFVLFWLGIWCESLVWVIMGRRGCLRTQAF